MRNFVLIFLLGTFSSVFAQLPVLGNDTLLDIATWNVEWLGDSGFGPTDENLQYANVSKLVAKADFDIIAMEEMSNTNTFDNLSNFLWPKYGSLNSTFQATQKMCLLYKRSMFEIIPDLSKNILNQYGNSAFATRPPLQVVLKTVGGTRTDTLYCIVVHMKAHTGNDAEKQDSYAKRKQAADYLKAYVEQYLVGKKFIILGDWNDDLNSSIYNNSVTPYKQFLDAGYLFATKQLTDAGKHSYAFGGKMIDHIMLAKSMDSLYIPASSRVFDIAGTYIANYSNTTTDHYPVYAFFNWKKLTMLPVVSPPPTGVAEVENATTLIIYPNPASTTITLNKLANTVVVYDALGREKLNFTSPQNTFDISGLENGVYFLQIEFDGNVSYERLLVRK